MDVLSTREQLMQALIEVVDWAEEIWICTAWASGARSKAPHWQALELAKVTRAVVGLDFNHTEPESLRALKAVPDRLRVVRDDSGTFHPKLLLGIRGDRGRALMGSSNLTVGGFGGNTELNLLLSGPLSESPLQELHAFIERQWNRPEARVLTDKALKQYERAWKRRRKQLRKQSIPGPLGPASPKQPVQRSALLEASWGEFVRMVEDQHGKPSTNDGEIAVWGKYSYLTEAKASLRCWRTADSFSSLAEDKRQLLAGYGPLSSGFFGRMSVSPSFTHAMAYRTADIARCLDRVPTSGLLSEREIGQILTGLVGISGLALGASTRLLTGCRPDIFFPVNNANRARLYQTLGDIRDNSTVHRVDDYIAKLKLLWQTPWFLAPEPEPGRPREIWRARAAMTDAIFYEA